MSTDPHLISGAQQIAAQLRETADLADRKYWFLGNTVVTGDRDTLRFVADCILRGIPNPERSAGDGG